MEITLSPEFADKLNTELQEGTMPDSVGLFVTLAMEAAEEVALHGHGVSGDDITDVNLSLDTIWEHSGYGIVGLVAIVTFNHDFKVTVKHSI